MERPKAEIAKGGVVLGPGDDLLPFWTKTRGGGLSTKCRSLKRRGLRSAYWWSFLASAGPSDRIFYLTASVN